MKTLLKKTIFAVVIALQTTSSSLAAIPRTSSFGVEYFRAEPMDYSKIVPMESLRGMKQEDIARWIPMDMQASDDGGRVFGKILSRGIQNYFNSPEMKNSSIMRTAQSVQDAVAQDISIGGEDGGIKHSFKFQLQAEKSQALLAYSGLANAQLSYNVSASELKFEVRESLAANTDLVLSHIDGIQDRRETVSVSFQF